MTIDASASRQFDLVAKAIAFIHSHARTQPTLEEVAAAVQLSPKDLQGVLADWAGISPEDFLQYLSKDDLRQRLAASAHLLKVESAESLSSPNKLSKLSQKDESMVSYEAMTPDQVKAAALGIDIGYGFGHSPFGDALVAWTTHGICHMAFRVANEESGNDGEAGLLAELSARWPAAALHHDDTHAHALLQRVFSPAPAQAGVHVVLRGTNFQIKIWEALIGLEPGQIVSYGPLARALHAPKSSRAVGSAIAANTIGFLVPCHRVIREGGVFGEYRWGSARKQAMIVWEAHRRHECVKQPWQIATPES